jgi:death-on-curing protein
VIEPVWLPIEDVIEANRDVVAETGEPFLVRDRGLLESSIAKPRDRYLYGGITDIAELATSLLFGIARNHPFEQGNKRTAFASAVMFLELNGYRLIEVPDLMYGPFIVAVLEGVYDENVFAQIFRTCAAIIE